MLSSKIYIFVVPYSLALIHTATNLVLPFHSILLLPFFKYNHGVNCLIVVQLKVYETYVNIPWYNYLVYGATMSINKP